MPEEYKEPAYWLTVWAVACLCSVSRCIHDRDYISVWHTCSVGSVGGFLGFATLALSGFQYGDPDNSSTFGLGVAAVVGLAGREQTELISMVWKNTVKRIFGGSTRDSDGEQ